MFLFWVLLAYWKDVAHGHARGEQGSSCLSVSVGIITTLDVTLNKFVP